MSLLFAHRPQQTAAALPTSGETLLPSQNGDGLERDELWSFAQKKTRGLGCGWRLCRRTRQIVAHTVGDRSQQRLADARVVD